jgi:tetratricopeptide (TPR) repeat protein
VKLLEHKKAIVRSGCILMLASVSCAFAVPSEERLEGDSSPWHDIEGRIQYYYFTEDSHALSGLQQQLTANGRDKLSGYYSAFAAYRLTQLTVRTDYGPRMPPEPGKSQVRELLGSCVSSLEPALAAQKDFADGLALQAACLGMTAELESYWRGHVSAARSESQLKRAGQVAPHNPRVLLFEAMADSGRDPDKALGELKQAIAGFEAERKDVKRSPGWGGAEAYALLARIHLQRGDALAARDALERSLLLAPAFADARRLLLQITS